jgi:hypothetical protein
VVEHEAVAAGTERDAAVDAGAAPAADVRHLVTVDVGELAYWFVSADGSSGLTPWA